MRTSTTRITPGLTAVIAMALLLPAAARQQVALKDLMPGGIVIGVAINGAQIDGRDQEGDRIIARQFNSISPENLLKWQSVHPEPDRYDFEPADRYVQFGRDHGMQVIGHILLWHSQTPRWVFQARTEPRRPRNAARPDARPHRHRRRPVQGPDRRLGRRQRGAGRGRRPARDAVARGDRRGLHRQGVRVRARGRPGRRAVLQRLQPVEARQAGGRSASCWGCRRRDCGSTRWDRGTGARRSDARGDRGDARRSPPRASS